MIKLPEKPFDLITTLDMWTDPYISLQMLKYHIDQTHNIASRKGETIQKTVDFISSFLNKDDTICDFGCGPGLYTDLLQRNGLNVIGCDISDNSLDYARKHNKNVDYRKFNYINEQLEQKIDTAMMIYLDFGAMPEVSQCKFLHFLHNSLNDDGLFFFDVCAIKAYDQITESVLHRTETNGFFMDGICQIETTTKKYNENHIVLKHDKAIGHKIIELYNWDKYFELNEIGNLLSKNGFKILDIYSDTVGNKDFDDNSIYFIKCQKDINVKI